jgi:hypothetical protein
MKSFAKKSISQVNKRSFATSVTVKLVKLI